MVGLLHHLESDGMRRSENRNARARIAIEMALHRIARPNTGRAALVRRLDRQPPAVEIFRGGRLGDSAAVVDPRRQSDDRIHAGDARRRMAAAVIDEQRIGFVRVQLVAPVGAGDVNEGVGVHGSSPGTGEM